LKKTIGKIFLLLSLFCSVQQSLYAQIEFVENKGQWDKKIFFKGEFSTGVFFVEKDGFTVVLNDANDLQNLHDFQHGDREVPLEKQILHSFAYKVKLLGCNTNSQVLPDKALATYNNYFIGNDKNNWATNCKIYTGITVKNIYPNIDMRYFSTADKMKYEFIVHPGGNPNIIAMQYDGPTALAIKNKELIITTTIATVKELAPYSYQTDVENKNIDTKFVLRDNVVSFNVSDYNFNATLVIDPQIIFSTFTGSRADNWGYTATPGADGTFYSGSIVKASGFPTSPGAYQTGFGGGIDEGEGSGYDIGIFKFTADGSNRVYATYLGGSGNEQPHSLIVDAAGNLIVAGRTNSPNFPVVGGLNVSGAGYDIIVTKFNAAGNALIGSVKIGGSSNDGVNIRTKWAAPLGPDRLRRNYGDDARSEVIVDAQNNIVLASCTQSSNFPVVNAFQPSSGGGQDGVVLKFNSNLNGLIFSSYFGGAAEDACFVTAINPINGNLYVGGATLSSNLPGNTAGTIGPNAAGNVDGFVTQLNPNGGAIIRTSYFGTPSIDLIYGLKFDKVGFPYIMGTTRGTWPVTPNVGYSVANAKQFIAKLQTDLSAYIYSTTFGTSTAEPNISPVAFLVDRCENVYVSGWGGGLNSQQNYSSGNTNGLPEVNPLTPIPPPDGADFYFSVINKNATSLLFGSHFGQFGGLGDHADGGTSRFDANGIIYQAICANCGGRNPPPINFPTTASAWAVQNGSTSCNLAAIKIDMNFAGIGAQIQSEIDGEINDTLGCLPLTVNFKDLRAKGVTYYWNFNSTANPSAVNATTTTPQTSFVFTTVGTYRVRLISEDLSTCNLRDTSYINIRVGDNRVKPQFTFLKRNPCTSTTYDFTNTTTNGNNITYLPNTFVWNFGDGTPNDTTSFNTPIVHTYASVGTYNVKLTNFDSRFCNAPKDTIIKVRVASNVKAKPVVPPLGCAPFTAVFGNESEAGISWLWDFGEPTSGALNSSTLATPTHFYQNIGTYKIRLIAYDSTTCNKIDTSAYFTLNVLPKPIAAGNWAPNPPEPNVPVRFTNTSQFADSYFWIFGDGETSTQFQPTHEYNATGTYNAKLVAISRAGCTDTFPLIVNVIVNPLLDVPNAFTPGRFGINSVVNVRGFGIEKMDWKIYNRWGQKIFQSDNKKNGWDGTYRGKLQPTDTYVYTLDVLFTDGKTLRKKGDITLIR
jgi:gliding motility-associated-like protein